MHFVSIADGPTKRATVDAVNHFGASHLRNVKCLPPTRSPVLQLPPPAQPAPLDATQTTTGVSVQHGAATEGDEIVFRVQVPTPLDHSVNVNYVLEDHTTAPGIDFEGLSGNARIEPGQTETHIHVQTIADNLSEPTETFRIRLTDSAGAEIAQGTAYGTIRDIDREPTIYVRPLRSTAGQDVEFVVNLSNPYKGGLTLEYATESGSAVAGRDFEPSTGALDFAPYQEHQIIKIPTMTAGPDTDGRDFSIRLTSPTAGRFAPIDDDQSLAEVASESTSVPIGPLAPTAKATAVLTVERPVTGPDLPADDPGAPMSPLGNPDPLLGVYGDTRYEGGWLKLTASLYHEVYNPMGGRADWFVTFGTANASDLYGTMWYEKGDAALINSLTAPSPAAISKSMSAAHGSMTWSQGGEESYAFWFWGQIDNVLESSEQFSLTAVGGFGVEVNSPTNYGTLLESGVVDVDVDSDNGGVVEQSNPSEDAIEYSSAHLGKRIFQNIDDDNLNGKPDKEDTAANYGPLDKDFAQVKLIFPTNGQDLEGYEFWLTANINDINFWENTAKKSLDPILNSNADGVRIQTNGEITNVIWTLGQGYSGPPAWVFAEGRNIKKAKISGYLFRASVPQVSPSFRSWDHVYVNVEKLVYPIQTQTHEDWNTLATNMWDGIEVAPAWHTSRSLENYFNEPTIQGLLETIHPDTLVGGKPGASEAGPDSSTTDTLSTTLGYEKGFEMKFDYSFERGRNSPYGYVSHPSQSKLSFVGNSGIKFGEGGQEVAILDVDAYVDMAGNINTFLPTAGGIIDTDPGPDITAKANINTPVTYIDEELSRLMTGVVYGPEHHDYGKAKDNPDRPNLPTSLNRYWTMLSSNEQRPNGKMRIVFDPAGNGTLTVYMDGATGNGWSYQDTAFTPMSLSELIVQSHWGSGVIFSNMDIVKLP